MAGTDTERRAENGGQSRRSVTEVAEHGHDVVPGGAIQPQSGHENYVHAGTLEPVPDILLRGEPRRVHSATAMAAPT